MDILMGLFLIAFGLVIAFVGLQMFFVILSILGFVTGFYAGAAIVEAIIGDGFLGTTTGWVVVNTAIVGASIVVGGVLLTFDQVSRQELADGAAVTLVKESWWWLLATGALAGVGIGRQLTIRDAVQVPEQRWAPANASPATG